MTSVGNNCHPNKQRHHMENRCCGCCDRNSRWKQQQRWMEAWCPRWCYLSDSPSARRGCCVCLARNASVTRVSHGKSLGAFFPPVASEYLHNPHATPNSPAQTDKSVQERWGQQSRGPLSQPARALIWSHQHDIRHQRSLLHTLSPPKIMFGYSLMWIIVCWCLCLQFTLICTSMSCYKPSEATNDCPNLGLWMHVGPVCKSNKKFLIKTHLEATDRRVESV